jgi:hypothetical protein
MLRALARVTACLALLFATSGCVELALHMTVAITRVTVNAALQGPHGTKSEIEEEEEAETERDETPCERKRRLWREVEQPAAGVAPPPQLRCRPDGDFPSPTAAEKAKSAAR